MLASAPDTVMKATNYIALESGGFDEPWKGMQKGIRDIRQMIHNRLSQGVSRREERIPDVNDDIYLSRRIFTRVSCLAH